MNTTTTRNATLADLADMLTEQHIRKHDLVVPAHSLRSVNGNLVVTGSEPVITMDGVTIADGTYRPTIVADEGLADKLGIPMTYLRRMRDTRIDLFDENVNGWLHGPGGDSPDARSFMLRTFRPETQGDQGIARALLSNSYARIDHLDVLTAALEGVQRAGADVEVDGADLTDRRMTVRIVAPAVKVLAENLLKGYRNPFGPEMEQWQGIAAREGMAYGEGGEPIVFAGLVLSNSETGGGAFTITPRMVIQVCKNGLKITRDAMRAVHLGGRMDDGVVRWSEETQERQLQLIVSKATDAVRTFLDVEYMTKTITALEEAAGKPVSTPDEVRELTKPLLFTKEQTDNILGYFIRGGQTTVGGVANAITAYAQMVDDGDDADALEAAATRLLGV